MKLLSEEQFGSSHTLKLLSGLPSSGLKEINFFLKIREAHQPEARAGGRGRDGLALGLGGGDGSNQKHFTHVLGHGGWPSVSVVPRLSTRWGRNSTLLLFGHLLQPGPDSREIDRLVRKAP